MPYTTYQPRLLILYDDPVALTLLTDASEKMAFFSRIAACRSSREALDVLHNESFDLLLLDYAVDDRNGLDIFELAKQMHSPVAGILVTAHDEKEVIISAMQAGIRDFIEKPIRPHILTNALNRAWEELEARVILDTENRNHLELLESLPDVVYKIDMDGYIQYINKTVEELGFSQEELKGKHITRIIAPEDYHAHSLQTVLDNFRGQPDAEDEPPKLVNERRGGPRRTQNLRIRLVSRNPDQGTSFREGRLVSFGEISATGILDGSVVTGSVGIIRDITERERERRQLKEALDRLRKSEEALKKAYNAKSRFVANMSYELRTPLNAITGMVDLIMDAESCKEQQSRLEVVKSSCRSLQFILDDIMDLSRIETNRLRLATVNFDPHDIMQEVLTIAKNLPEAKELDIRAAAGQARPCPRLKGDAERIRQILLNLVHNALKYTDKGFVEIGMDCRAVDKKEYMRLICTVRDSGIGISRDKQEAIFERFDQPLDVGSRRYGGRGLGLAISRKLARLMRGDIQVDSEPGLGSSFTFAVVLPKADGISQHVENADTVSCSGTALVVEDNMTNRAVIKNLIESLGVRVDTAQNGREALEKAQNQAYPIIFMDLQMPEIDGMDICKKIRESGGPCAGAFIVALTADVDEHTIEQCRETGMNEYLPKPVGKHELRRIFELFEEAQASGDSDFK
ncbi:MAG: response regulator [Desulfobacterales bacterium]